MSNQATKHDQGKPRMELLPPEALEEIAKVLTFGSKKYDAHNWRKGFEYSRLLGAALRHITAYNGGEDKDPESGLSHLSHASCCLMFLITQEVNGTGTDDRFKPLVDFINKLPKEAPDVIFPEENKFKQPIWKKDAPTLLGGPDVALVTTILQTSQWVDDYVSKA